MSVYQRLWAGERARLEFGFELICNNIEMLQTAFCVKLSIVASLNFLVYEELIIMFIDNQKAEMLDNTSNQRWFAPAILKDGRKVTVLYRHKERNTIFSKIMTAQGDVGWISEAAHISEHLSKDGALKDIKHLPEFNVTVNRLNIVSSLSKRLNLTSLVTKTNL